MLKVDSHLSSVSFPTWDPISWDPISDYYFSTNFRSDKFGISHDIQWIQPFAPVEFSREHLSYVNAASDAVR